MSSARSRELPNIITGTLGGVRSLLEMRSAHRLTPKECDAKAVECRALAQRAVLEPHRIMLEHIAETWDRIGAEIKNELH